MPEMAVKFPFIGYDKTSPAFKSMRSNLSKFGDSSKSIFRRMRSDALSVKGVMGGILGARAVTYGLGALRNQISTVKDEIIDFDAALVKATARYGFDRYSEQFKELGLAARDVGAKTRFTAAEAARTIDEFARANINAKDAMLLAMPAAKLAVAADLDVAQASEIAATSLAVFSHGAKDFSKDADVLAFTANHTKLSLSELYETLKSGGAAQMGGSITTFSALARSLADFKIIGEKAGTSLKTGLMRLMTGGKTADKEIKRLGLRTFDLVNGKEQSRGVLDVLEDLENKYKKMGSKSVATSMRKLFGLDSIVGMEKIFRTGIAKIREFKQEAENSTGYVEGLSSKMGLSYENKLKEIQSAVVEVGFQIIDGFGKEIPGALEKTIKHVRSIDTQEIRDDIDWARDTASETVGFLKQAYPMIKSLAILWAGFKIKNGISIIGGTVADVAMRTSRFRSEMNGLHPVVNKVNGSLKKTGGGLKLIKNSDPRGLGASFNNIRLNAAKMNEELRQSKFRVGDLGSAINALPVLLAGASGWKSAIDSIFEDANNRLESFRGKADRLNRETSSTGSIARLNTKEDLRSAYSKVKEGIDASKKSFEFTPSSGLNFATSTLFGGESEFEKSLKTFYELNTKKKLIERKAREIDKIENGSTGPEGYNRDILNSINAIEGATFKNKVEVEAVIKFEGNVPEGTTAEVRTKAPSIDKKKLGKNAA